MKNRAVLGLAGAAAWAIACSASAEPFRSFVDICLSTNGDAQAVATAAKDGDWFEMPAEALEDMGKEFRDPAIYLNFDPSKKAAPVEPMEILLTGWGDGKTTLEIDGLRFDACGLMSPDADSRTLSRSVTAHLGFSPITKGGMTLWLYSRKTGGFVSEAALMDSDDETFVAALKERKLYALYIINEGDMAGLVLGAVRPAP